MTWLDLLNYLKETPYYLLEKEVIIYQHEKDGTHRSFEINEVCCPSWNGEYWDPDDGMLVQIRLNEFHYEHGRKVPGPEGKGSKED